MADETMPVTEAQVFNDEVAEYECAFHILPTVADEEVSGVADALRERIVRAGGTITTEEAPQRFDLAYDISVKVGGTNRTFNASHFGWMRFTLEPGNLPALEREVANTEEIFRHLIVRLTREEAEHPYIFFKTKPTEAEASEEVRDEADETAA